MVPRSILLTGAGGFVGRHLQRALAEAFPEAALHAAEFDVTDAAAVAAAVRKTRPEACVHLAAVSAIGAARADPDHAWRVNLHGTLHLARALLGEARECRLVFASSAEIYGESFRAGRMLDEQAVPAPLNTYAATKAAADLALGAMAAEGLRVIRIRPFNHTGPGQSESFVVAAFARQIARIEAGLQTPVIRVGALDPARDFLDVRDVCAAYVAAIRREALLPPGTVLNLASGTPRRVGTVLDALLHLAGIAARVEADPARMRTNDIPLAGGDASRARMLLDWQPRIAWETTLADVLEDWRGRAKRERRGEG
ncbi:MAG TPA: GDP-mannose 4,6-dehydratase [Acetobacteraceae bacterium]|nr:GDP-mannose 4,6-dehydratase [Acetobacteraceae bacterium]